MQRHGIYNNATMRLTRVMRITYDSQRALDWAVCANDFPINGSIEYRSRIDYALGLP